MRIYPGKRGACGRNRQAAGKARSSAPRRPDYTDVVRGRFRIIDPVCLDVLRAVRDAFDDEGLPFAIAGGMAAQALLAAAGLDHMLRTSGDIDLVVDGEDARIVRALNALAAAHQEMLVVQNPAAKNARVGPLNIDWINEPTKLRGLEHAWARSIEHALVVRVRQLELPVQEPEMLVAAKLTGHRVRPQDELDVLGVLYSRVELDDDRIREFLTSWPDRLQLFEELREQVQED
jgi:hypothetical protein